MKLAVPLAAALALPGLPAAAEGYGIALVETGRREYYCTARMRLTNATDAPLAELAVVFHLFEDGAPVGRSKGASFLDVPPGGAAEAVFETPNAPCDAALTYRPTVGACRLGPSFADKALCAARIAPVAPVTAPASQGPSRGP